MVSGDSVSLNTSPRNSTSFRVLSGGDDCSRATGPGFKSSPRKTGRLVWLELLLLERPRLVWSEDEDEAEALLAPPSPSSSSATTSSEASDSPQSQLLISPGLRSSPSIVSLCFGRCLSTRSRASLREDAAAASSSSPAPPNPDRAPPPAAAASPPAPAGPATTPSVAYAPPPGLRRSLISLRNASSWPGPARARGWSSPYLSCRDCFIGEIGRSEARVLLQGCPPGAGAPVAE